MVLRWRLWIFNRHDFSYFSSTCQPLATLCFNFIRLVFCEMSKTDFQDGGCGGHLGFPIDMVLAHFGPRLSCCYRASFGSNRPKIWEEILKIDFQDGDCGGHLGFPIGSVLSILCLLGIQMLLIKFNSTRS